MQASKGILTARGGMVSHAAVVARGWGIPAVVGAGELHIENGVARLGDVELRSGDEITIDGDIQGKDCLLHFKKKGRVRAVASIFRDLESLKAELTMERAEAA